MDTKRYIEVIEELKTKTYDNYSTDLLIQELDIYHAELTAQNEELIEKEKHLLELRAEYELFFNNAALPYIIIDNSLCILHCNNYALRTFPRIKLNTVKSSIVSLIDKVSLYDFLRFTESLEDEDFGIFNLICEDSIIRKFKVITKLHPFDKGKIVLTLIDVHDEELYKQKLLKEVENINKQNMNNISLLQQESKLARMGELVLNIAHQWKQPLNILSALNMDFILKAHKKEKLEKSDLIEFKEETELVINKMNNTLSTFMDFYSPNREKKYFYADQVLKKLEYFLDSWFMEDNHFDVECENDILIYAYENDFLEILQATLKNAMEAIISKEIKNGKVSLIIKKENKKTIITIQDNAGGVKEDDLENILEPFYTTKPGKLNSGIGLYMVKIVTEKSFNGKLTLSNLFDGLQVKIEI